MEKVIIYNQENGIVAIVRPTQEALEKYGIEAIAKKDVPAGVPYAIIDAKDIPEDRTFRNAWVADIEEPHGYGSESSVFEEVTND